MTQQNIVTAAETSVTVLPDKTNARRSRNRARAPGYLRYQGKDIERLQTVSEDDLHRAIELLKTQVDSIRLFIQKQMAYRRQWFQSLRRRKPKQKIVRVMPNTTTCAKRVFSIQEDNPNGKTIARGFCHLFTPSILDRKSGSAGMPRPISYAVFCLENK